MQLEMPMRCATMRYDDVVLMIASVVSRQLSHSELAEAYGRMMTINHTFSVVEFPEVVRQTIEKFLNCERANDLEALKRATSESVRLILLVSRCRIFCRLTN